MHLNMSYSELQKMPVRYRHWFVKRLSKHFDQKNKAATPKKQSENFAPLTRIEEIINKKLE